MDSAKGTFGSSEGSLIGRLPSFSQTQSAPSTHSRDNFNFPPTFDAPLPKPPGYKRQRRDPKYTFENCVSGYLIKLLKFKENPVPFEQLMAEILPALPKLRKVDGNFYRGDPDKIIRGALASVGCFKESDDCWSLDKIQAEAYRENCIKQINRRTCRTRVELSLPERSRKNKLDRMVQMLDKFVMSMNKEPLMKSVFSNPFAKFTGSEDLLEASSILGKERLIGVLQGFELVKQYFDNLKKEGTYNGFDSILRSIYERLERLETRLSDAVEQ